VKQFKEGKNNYHIHFFKVLLIDETSTINQLNAFLATNVTFCGCKDVKKEGANICMRANTNIVLLLKKRTYPYQLLTQVYIPTYTTSNHVFFHFQSLVNSNENRHFPLFLDLIGSKSERLID